MSMELSHQFSQAFSSRSAYRCAVRMSRAHAPTGYRRTQGLQHGGQGFGNTLRQFLPHVIYSSKFWPLGTPVSGDVSGLETSDAGEQFQDSAAIGEAAPSAVVLTQEDVWKWRGNQARTMIAFMLPALSIPLVDPLMSLVVSFTMLPMTKYSLGPGVQFRIENLNI